MTNMTADDIILKDGKIDNPPEEYFTIISGGRTFLTITPEEAKRDEAKFGVNLATDQIAHGTWHCVCFPADRHESRIPINLQWVVVVKDQLIEILYQPPSDCGGIITRSPTVTYYRYPLVINIGEHVAWLTECGCNEDGDEVIIPEEFYPYHLILSEYQPNADTAYEAPKLRDELDVYLKLSFDAGVVEPYADGELFFVAMPIVTDNPDIVLKKRKHQH